MLRHSFVLSLCAVALLCGPQTASAVPYFLTELGPAGADTLSCAYGVSLVGGAPMAGGFSQDFAVTPNQRKPVVWNSNGVATDLLPLLPGATAGTGNQTNAIDTNGDVVGATIVGGNTVAFYLPSGGAATILPTLGGTGSTSATGVTNLGMVAGYSPATDGNTHAFVWSAVTGMIDLGQSGSASSAYAISADGNTIVGTTGPNPQACKWTRTGSTWTMTPLVQFSQYNQTWAYAVNSSGNAVGGCFDYPQGGFPNVFQIALEYKFDGTIVRIGGVGSNSAYARGINDSGVIVGYDGTTSFVNYTGTPGANTALTSLLAPGQGTGWTFTRAYGIDNNGDIVGYGKNAAGISRAYLLKPALTGDANLDGTVNIQDLSKVLTNYDATGKLWADGDFNGDGTVNISDLSNVLTNYDRSMGASAAGIRAVPEPSGAVLTIVCVAGLVLGLRQKRD
jgi:probable HAF family extracellular repeat protein